MKGILEFNLPEEYEQFQEAQESWKGIVRDMDNYLRTEIKHGGKAHLQSVRDFLYELMNDMGLDLWD